MKTSQISFFVILAAGLCSAHIGGQSAHQEKQVYCGRSLARALALLCYDGLPANKRTEAGMYNAVLAPYYKEQEMHLNWPWVTPYKARGMDGPRSKRQFIVNECCEKPCSINELFTYC